MSDFNQENNDFNNKNESLPLGTMFGAAIGAIVASRIGIKGAAFGAAVGAIIGFFLENTSNNEEGSSL